MADPVAFHVHGPAVISIGKQGTAGALTQVGISEDGVDWVPTFADEAIMTDAGGSRIPEDIQDMGVDATITFRLVKYTVAGLKGMLQHRIGAAGTQLSRGRPMFQAGMGFRLVIDGDQDEPYRFFQCVLRGAQRVKLGTRRKAWDLTVYAAPMPVGSGWSLYDNQAK